MNLEQSTRSEPDDQPAHVSLRERELAVAQEIAHAFLTATQPLEVYRLALERVAPLVDASFSSVFLREQTEDSLLKLACAHNWPQSSARFLSELRIRVGRGPTGRAVASRRAIEVEDVFADPALREWWEPARELGFASLIALPLMVEEDEAVGALSFYFDDPHRFDGEERKLLSLIADQLAATAEKAHLIDDLRTANRRLTRRNRELSGRVREAEEAQQLKNEFLANMSHELRTPLTAILGYTFLLSEHEDGLTEEQSASVGKIQRSGNALLRLIEDLLELSRLKLRRAQPARESEDAEALAERAVGEAGPVPEEIDFRLRAPEEHLPLVTDADKVAKILVNLLSNAFKFTAEGAVTLTVGRPDAGPGRVGGPDQVEWAVEDTGIGIAPGELDSIFDEFRQVDGSSTRLYGGTGLGLALSLRLARLLGGDITVESEPGAGSRFTLRLPTAPSPADPPPAE